MTNGNVCYGFMTDAVQLLFYASALFFLINTKLSQKLGLFLALMYVVARRFVKSLRHTENELSNTGVSVGKLLKASIGLCVLCCAARRTHAASLGAMLLCTMCVHKRIRFKTTGRCRPHERTLVAMLHHDDPHWSERLSTRNVGNITEAMGVLLSGVPGAQRVVFARHDLGYEWFHRPIWGYFPVRRRGEDRYNKNDQKSQMLAAMTTSPSKVFVLYPRGGFPKEDTFGPGFVHLTAASGSNLCLMHMSEFEGTVYIGTLYVNRGDEPTGRPHGFEDLAWPPPKRPEQTLARYIDSNQDLLARIHKACWDELIGRHCKFFT